MNSDAAEKWWVGGDGFNGVFGGGVWGVFWFGSGAASQCGGTNVDVKKSLVGLRGEFKRGKKACSRAEKLAGIRLLLFFLPIRLCGFGGRAGGTKVRRREKGKRIS